MTINILITGSNGQLGYELQRSVPVDLQDTVNLTAADVDLLDITDNAAVERVFAELKPDWVINGAAYTAVDKAEDDEDKAYAINATGAKNLAQACAKHQSRLLHISTDFIFDGKNHKPYQTDEPAAPISVYGSTKLAGEQAVLDALPNQSIIIRTAWLYSAHGHNFVKTMLSLMQSRDALNVVYDQIGSPTWANTLAQTCWAGITHSTPINGVYHCSDNGIASWYDFAVAIQEEALALGLLNKRISIRPIPGSQYPTPAARPHYSVMDKASTEADFSLQLPHWRDSLRAMLCELKTQL